MFDFDRIIAAFDRQRSSSADRAAARRKQRAATRDERARESREAVDRPVRGPLTGAGWWRANQARFPNSRRLEDLDGQFRDNATAFVAALRQGGANVSIGSTRRNRIRAHLMHYSWRVAHGEVAPSNVPAVAGLEVRWMHATIEASRKGADEMVRLFRMAHVASLTSNHIRGRAIDMTITWKGALVVAVPGESEPVVIDSGPRNGANNHALHRLGERFGVRKLRSDPPHWSLDGR